MVWNNVEQASLLRNVNNIATGLSFIGSIFIMYQCLRTPSPRSVTTKLILSIGIADFIYSIANLMSSYEDLGPTVSTLCSAEATLRSFSFLLSIFFASCLGIICYKTLSRGPNFEQERFFERSLYVGVLYCTVQVLM